MSRNRMKFPLLVHEKPRSVISEKFRGIRSNIMFASARGEIRSFIITAESPTVGKSFITANVAISYAQAGYRTLVIDGDMRKPTQNYLFDTPNYHGLSSLIISHSNFEKAIYSTEIENLDLLPSGPIPPNPSELIDSDEFYQIYQTLLNEYDFIIVDTPPVNTVTDAQVYLKYINHALMVIDVENNNKKEVRKAKALLEKTGGKILGAVLNKTPHEKSASYYYYGENE
ncbi:polysaccharide biosynthesis tyrosine autokinase [Staphylococcus durrellii]|uniref:polysaccharide biosynthesis tyrosine autokinase n=1 Tax=Staphylococcus durrellii TaxID=2781773 RepID=UPI00189F5030|nr:polysaccharide biosynthesis tyrosine autokinase [Staphylococcus durrellii]MBF7018005.1 polysaccharide biosynthesis tyrosine autokinase [Staphylococcus durrellii]